MTEKGLPASGKRLLDMGPVAIKREAENDLDKILQDVLKKSRDTEHAHTLPQVASLATDTPNIAYSFDADADALGQSESTDQGFRKSVQFSLVDPVHKDEVRVAIGSAYKWDGCPSHSVAIMKVASPLEVVDKVWDKIPAGRTVRAIFGAIENPTKPSPIPDITRLKSDKEVAAFFTITNSNPISLQVVLWRNSGADPQREDSAPPDDGAYFPADFLTTDEQYYDPAEDSDTFRRNLARYTKRGMPRNDEAFGDRKIVVPKGI